MTLPLQRKLQDHVRGSRWPGVPQIGPVLVNGAAPDEPLERAVMEIYRSPKVAAEVTFDSEDGGIIINDAAAWDLQVPEPETGLPLDEGRWLWVLKFYTASNPMPYVWYAGTIDVLPVFPEVES